MAADGSVEALRDLAASSVLDASAQADRLWAQGDRAPDLAYLLAELRARSGRPHEALDLIDIAQREYRRAGRDLDAERCDVGRVAVLDDLGRHDDAIVCATAQLARLRGQPPSPDLADLEVRVLGNRALCLESVGRYAEAADDYEQAIAAAADRGDSLMSAHLLLNRSNVLGVLGRTEEALDGLRRAAATLDDSGEREDRVKVAANIGSTLCRRGEYAEGLEWFRRAEQLVEPGTDDEWGIAVDTAEALAGLGAYGEAIERYRTALDALSKVPLSWLEGRAWLGLGLCCARTGAVDAARAALLSAIDAFQAADNLPSKLTALLELSALEADDPATAQFALDEARQVLALADVDRSPFHACVAHLKLAELTTGAESERRLRAAHRLATRIHLAPLSMRVEQRLGHYLLERGRHTEAAPHVEAAVQHATALRGELRHRALLRSFPTETASCYEDLVELRLAHDDLRGAFQAADQARSRSLVDLGLTPPHRPETAAVDALTAELHVIYNRLLGVEERLDPVVGQQLEQRARDLEAQLDRAQFELTEFSDPSRTPDPPRTGGARSALTDLVLLYRVRGDDIDLFVRTADGGHEFHRSMARVSRVVSELARFHAEGRRQLALRSAGVGRPGRGTGASRLHHLGEMLLGPVHHRLVAAAGASPQRIVVVPDGPLHAVPFAALGIDSPRDTALLERAVISVSASPSLFELCAVRQRRAGAPLLVGVSGGGIPGARREVESIASAIPGATVLLDDDATLDRVTAAVSSARLVHLASHGMFRPAAPLHSGVRLADGWLSAARAARLPLQGALVVLSACETGRSRVDTGQEILGLQYGFFAGGASSLVMSLWPAHDESTVDLMLDFHGELGHGASPAAALRGAQLQGRATHEHPWLWAPFVVAGAG